MNEATDYINKYEVELDVSYLLSIVFAFKYQRNHLMYHYNPLQEARNEFRELLKESMEKIKLVAKKLGNSIETAKPYYEARLYASQVSIIAYL